MLRYICNILLLLVPAALLAAAPADSVIVLRDTTTFTTDTLVIEKSVMTDDTVGVVHADSTLVINRIAADAPRDTLQLFKKQPVYQGFYINVDIFNPIATAWRGGRFEFVVSADVSLWHRLFPSVDYGMMFMNHYYDEACRYKSNGLFVRAGAMYNFLNNKPDRKRDHLLGVGVKYAYSNVAYSTTGAIFTDDYWVEMKEAPAETRVTNVGWVEFFASVRVQIYKDFFMGINAKVKTFTHFYKPCAIYPTYIPGFGQYSDGALNFGIEYMLTYRIPSKKLKQFRAQNGL